MSTKFASDQVNGKAYTPYDYGAVGDGVTDDSAALTALFANNMSVYIPDGKFRFSTPIVVTGKRGTIFCDTDAALEWEGVTAAHAFTFGDNRAVVSSTQGWDVYNLRVVDRTAGTVGIDSCVRLNRCDRSQFYNLSIAANPIKESGGAGLLIDNGGIILDFYSSSVRTCYKGIMFAKEDPVAETSVVGANFYNLVIESTEGHAVHLPANIPTTNVRFHGGVIEDIEGDGVLFEQPPGGWSFDNMYWEGIRGTAINDDYATATDPVVLNNCRFKDCDSANAAVVVNSTAVYHVSTTEFTDQPLIELVNASSKAVLKGNFTRSPGISGTADGTTANKLIDSGANFDPKAKVGLTVFNNTDGTQAFITAIDSDISLSLSADIMVSGESYTVKAQEVRETGSSKWVEYGGIDGTGNYEINTGTGVAQLNNSELPTVAVLGATTGADLIGQTSGATIQDYIDERAATVDITAYAGGGQANAVELTTQINEVDTVGTTGDSVKLPPASTAGLKRTIINAGANALDVFPNTSDNLGAGVNTAVSLAAGANITYVAYSGVLWTAMS